ALDLALTELEPLIGGHRRRHTKDGARGMPPHVTLVYPFAETAAIDDELLRAVGEAVAPHPELQLELRAVSYFTDGENTLYLAPALPVALKVERVALHVDTVEGWRLHSTLPLNRHTRA